MVVVSNSGPLISLAKIGKFSFLKLLSKRVIIPEAVYDEVVKASKGRPGEKETQEALGNWIELKGVRNHLAVQLLEAEIKKGEAESIVLAKELNANLLLIDDNEGRSIAEKNGLKVKGTVGLILIAYYLGLLENPRQTIDELRDKGFYLKDGIYERILKKVAK